MHFVPRPPRFRRALLVATLGALAACSSASSDPTPQTSTGSGRQLVTLTYQVPDGYTRVTAPSRSPQSGMTYDISTFEQDSSGCALQVTRVLMTTSNKMEDQDVTYNLVSGMATAQGIDDADKATEGLYFPGDPGPVPALQVRGDSASRSVRIAGRLSNESLQGFTVMLLCPKGDVDDASWEKFLGQFRVDGFRGTLEAH